MCDDPYRCSAARYSATYLFPLKAGQIGPAGPRRGHPTRAYVSWHQRAICSVCCSPTRVQLWCGEGHTARTHTLIHHIPGRKACVERGLVAYCWSERWTDVCITCPLSDASFFLLFLGKETQPQIHSIDPGQPLCPMGLLEGDVKIRI